jgi:hypothetical protein
MCFLKKGILGGLLGLFTWSSAGATTEPNPMNVLFIGNSYTHMNSMPKLFEKIAVSKKMKINVEMSAKSSHTFKMHCQRPEMFEAIKSKKWDYVVIQGFSRELMYDYSYIDTASIPYFNKIVDSIYANNPCTNILLYMTWGYKNGSDLLPETDSYEKMAQRISNGYKYLSNIYDIPIVPVGHVHKYIRQKFPQINLYTEDDQHPTIFGSYMAACTFYSAIFKSSPFEGAMPSSISQKDGELIQRASYNVVSNHLNTYKLLKNTLDVDYEKTKSNTYFAYCKSNFPNAKSIRWDFGDGTSSTERNVVHKYKTHGTYLVKLTVNDQCGVREIYRRVHFKEPQAPAQKKPSKPKTTTNGGKKI